MNVLDHFSVPYLGLKNGPHKFKFEVDDAFFKKFEYSPIQSGSFDVLLDLDKRPDMGIAIFNLTGSVDLECDRCLQPMQVKIKATTKLHIKYGEEDPLNDEVMFIDLETSKINFAPFIYESIIIHLPMRKMHQKLKDCDPEVIKRLQFENPIEEEIKNDPWNLLKNLDLN